MPKDLPDTAQLWQGLISFFSIDTDLIQSAGYNFKEGELLHLPSQLPAAMNLQITEVVVREVINHQMESIIAAANSLRSASKSLSRVSALHLDEVDKKISEVQIEDTAQNYFRQLISDYTKTCGGGIIPIEGADISSQIFERYFKGEPPFGKKKDKKSEFPDAANMLLLETHAKESGTKGIVASRDGGVADFAASSDYLYCVKSLEDLAALFIATSGHAQEVKDRIIAEISDENSVIRDYIRDEIVEHLGDSRWVIDDVYSSLAHRADADIYGQKLLGYKINLKSSEIWDSIDAKGVWIFEVIISAQTELAVEITFYAYDTIDHDEVEIANESVEIEEEVQLKAFIRLANVSEGNPPYDWDIEVDIGRTTYWVDIGEVNPKFEHQYYDE